MPAGTDHLNVNEILTPGQCLVSADARFKFFWQPDGYAVVYGYTLDGGRVEFWRSKQYNWQPGTPAYNLTVRTVKTTDDTGNPEGIFTFGVLYPDDTVGDGLTNTQAHGAQYTYDDPNLNDMTCYVLLQNGGNLVFYWPTSPDDSKAIWATNEFLPDFDPTNAWKYIVPNASAVIVPSGDSIIVPGVVAVGNVTGLISNASSAPISVVDGFNNITLQPGQNVPVASQAGTVNIAFQLVQHTFHESSDAGSGDAVSLPLDSLLVSTLGTAFNVAVKPGGNKLALV